MNKTDETQASPEVANESPFFMNVFLAVGGHCTASTSGRVRQHLTREESWNNRDKKIKERECTCKRPFHRYSRRGILNSQLTWGIDGWRNKITAGHRTRTFRTLCLKSLMTHYNVRCFN